MLYDSPTTDRERVLLARWLRVKHLPPVGYIHNRYGTAFMLDPATAPLLRQAWERVLAGVAVDQVHRELNDELEFRTPRRGQTGGRPLARGAFYRMLRDPFYSGKIRSHLGTVEGEQEALVTDEQFGAVQEMLTRRRKSKTKRLYEDLVR